MDHLPLPIDDFVQRPLEIPLLCNDRFRYDDHGFLTYADRAGLPLADILERGLAEVDSLAPALQAWLWFGLLGETLGIGSRSHIPQRIASYENFVVRRAEGIHIISTTDLHRCISETGKRNRLRREDGFYADRFFASLNMANTTVRDILSSKMCTAHIGNTLHFYDLPVFYRIVFSIQILIESLEMARHIIVPWKSDLIFRPPLECSGLQLVNKRLSDAGWCPYDINRTPRSLRMRYYLSFLRPAEFRSVGSHKSCTEEACVNKESQKDDIRPKHVTNGCQCNTIGIDDGVISQIFEAGRVPLIRFSGPAGATRKPSILDIHFREDEEDCDTELLPFVAISHVRRAGLGNTSTHSLPYCQLACIQELANSISSTSSFAVLSSSTPETSTPFWLDTICIPSNPLTHEIALTTIRRTYSRASHILVLDPSLYQYNIDGAESALIRIRYSLWKQRLWTLQEGSLVSPARLIFRFANSTVSLASLLASYEAEATFSSPLVACHNTGGFGKPELQVLGGLKEVLELLDHDIKSLKRMPVAAARGLERGKLHAALRLGYLSFTRYCYFREEWETLGMAAVLRVLALVYLGERGVPLQMGTRSQDEVVRGLRRLAALPCLVI